MLNHSDLNRLYNLLLENKELTTKNLNECGFNSKDINKLINQEILRRIKIGSILRRIKKEGLLRAVKKGHYEFLRDDKLVLYGKKLVEEKEYEKADKCFLKCYELNPFNYDACIETLLISISKKEYELCFKCIDTLFAFENQHYRTDANLYLFLLRSITNVPERYKDYVKDIRIEDICTDLTDTRYESIHEQNKMRTAIFNIQFTHAIKLLNDIAAKEGCLSKLNKIIKHLLVQAYKKEEKDKSNLLNMVDDKRYSEIIDYLEKKKIRCNLGIADYYSMKLCRRIINIKETGERPEKNEVRNINNIFDAIDSNDFELAFKLSEEYNEKNGIKSTTRLISILLSDIIDLIYENSYKNKKVKFVDVLGFLLNSDLDNAFKTLNSYMKCIDKEEYEFLIVNLIKLDLIKKDIAYTNTIVTLTCITQGYFYFDISNYIKKFYMSLFKEKFEQAKIYLDIISNSSEFKNNINFINGLSNELKDALEKQKSNNNIVKTNEKKPFYSEDKSHVPSGKESPIQMENEARDSEKEFIETKCDKLLKEKGAILLKPMDNQRRKKIHNMIKKYPNIVSFSIGEASERRIVLRYTEKQTEYIDYKELLKVSTKLYEQGKYDDCIEINLQLLQYGSPRSIIYSSLGLAYMKKFKLDLAIDYLTIATYMAKQENSEFDYTELIQRLKGATAPECYKPYFKMNVSEFKSDLDNYYGINNISEITEYIIKTGIDVESACLHFGMTSEQTNIIYLIYAREYYSQSLYDKGDEFLKEFERSKNKTDSTIKIYDEIRKNRRFYFNREKKNSYCLTLTIHPKKR